MAGQGRGNLIIFPKGPKYCKHLAIRDNIKHPPPTQNQIAESRSIVLKKGNGYSAKNKGKQRKERKKCNILVRRRQDLQEEAKEGVVNVESALEEVLQIGKM